MDAVTDFILQNTVWIIIIAAIFAMALIGFIAEQNGYGEKKPKAKKVKEAKQKEETIEIEPLKEEMISLPQEPVKEETVVEKKEEPKKEILNIWIALKKKPAVILGNY